MPESRLNVNKPIEISGEYEVDKNKIKYDIDVWGTELGVRAQQVYAYYVQELEKYCLVNHTYWSL